MKKLMLLVGVLLVGAGSALTYHLFETVVHGSIDFIWYDTFDTDTNRILVLSLTLFFSLIFFGLQHWLDPKSEGEEEQGLGDMPKPVFSNYAKVLLIGFFSLLAGAALGPEAILVPACTLLGGIVGTVAFKKDKQATGLLAAAGLIALFAAFFNSFWIGLLSLFLVLSSSKTKFKPVLLVIAALASAASVLTLKVVEAKPYIQLPGGPFNLNTQTVIGGIVLAIAGYIIVTLIAFLHSQIVKLRNSKKLKNWAVHSIVASLGLAILFLVGGSLVEFTGNKSIMPMFDEAAALGLAGLLWILLVKVVVISWSKAIGYRGGMIFPTIFLATVLVAIVQLYVSDFNVVFGVIVVLVGSFIANRKSRILV